MEEYFRHLHVEAQQGEFQQKQQLQRYYYHHQQVEAAKHHEWQQQLYLFQQQQLHDYQKSRIHQLRLEIFGANLEYLTRTASTHDIDQGSTQHKPSHFSLFSYDIHDKDAFRKSISRTGEKPKQDNESTKERGFVRKERESNSEKQSPSMNVCLTKRKCQEYLNG